MIVIGRELIVFLKSLKKAQLNSMAKDYNKLALIFDDESIGSLKASNSVLINKLEENKKKYFNNLVKSLDKKDFNVLKKILTKKITKEYLEENKNTIDYFVEKRILWQKESLEIPEDIYPYLKEFVKDKEIINYINNWNDLYNLVNGIVIAYGVVDRSYFDDLLKNSFDLEKANEKLDFYYKKEYSMDSKKVISTKLSSKKRINKYLKDKDLKEFTNKDYILLGSHTYHRKIKSYKKFISLMKKYYVHKKEDISFIDMNIVTPYLYTSINEEQKALDDLEKIIDELFEFKNDKLKQKLLTSIVAIRDYFPLWEYRGFTKVEVSK